MTASIALLHIPLFLGPLTPPTHERAPTFPSHFDGATLKKDFSIMLLIGYLTYSRHFKL